MSVKISSHEKNWIKLFGSFGEFSNSDGEYTIRFFSTFANNKQRNSGPAELLKELKPMRERINPNEIKDINSLLQRDLNDSRVANELIPYLQSGNVDNISFFPSILAALIPNSFLNSTSDSNYPKPSESDPSDSVATISYGEKWILEKFLDDNGDETPLGSLKIDPHDTEVVVLDGQHRANAFRVLCGAFDDNENKLYEAFYEGITENTSFPSDLPVTIIWFESKNKDIDPTLISRKLFVDVNSHARAVSESRKILLNDFEPSSVLTKYFYSQIASEQSFSLENFSLLHSGFDIDSDLNYSTPHVFTLTIPQIIHSTIEWVFFGRIIDQNLDRYYVKKSPSNFTDTSKCAKLLPNFKSMVKVDQDEENQYRKRFIGNSSENEFQEEFNDKIYQVFFKLLNDHILIANHINACSNFKEKSEWLSNKRQIWQHVFIGGEGLYYSFKNIPKGKVEASETIESILTTIDEIEIEFIQERASAIDDIETKRINDAYKSIRTKAFQIGYFSAFFQYLLDHYTDYTQENIEACLDKFLEKINSISTKGWVNILDELRRALIKGTDPKKWPAYHKIFLRIIAEKGEYFDNEDNLHLSPEAQVFRNFLDDKLDGWARTNGIMKNSISFENIESMIDTWNEQSEKETKDLFANCEIDILEGINWEEISTSFFKKKVDYNEVEDDEIED